MSLLTWFAVHTADATRRLAELEEQLQRRRAWREVRAERSRNFDAVAAGSPYLQEATWGL